MKILITFYALNDLGGIINNQEGLYAGLRALGHEVAIKELHWKEKITDSSPDTSKKIKGEMGLLYDQRGGWTWPKWSKFPYKGKYNLKRWKDYASTFDLIIWQIPVPTKQRANFGNLDWLELYNVPVKQIAYVHDGNFEAGSPHLYAIMKHLTGVTGVHPCAYNSLKVVPLPRAMTFSSQMNIDERIAAARASHTTRDGCFSLQTFKGWKHVEDIVRAVPYMKDYPMTLAGGGIQWYYMTSKDKCKEAFKVDRKYDPDCDKRNVGKPIWDIAIKHGMDYLGYIHNEERERQLHAHKFLIDPSWSVRYAANGDHFNRVVVDAIIAGAAPIARPLGIAHDVSGIGDLFRPDQNYFMIPMGVTPKEYAERINYYVAMDDPVGGSGKAAQMVERARAETVPHFDYRKVAQSFIDLANGKPAGYHAYALGQKKNAVGKLDAGMQERCDRLMNGFFAGVETKEEVEEE